MDVWEHSTSTTFERCEIAGSHAAPIENASVMSRVLIRWIAEVHGSDSTRRDSSVPPPDVSSQALRAAPAVVFHVHIAGPLFLGEALRG